MSPRTDDPAIGDDERLWRRIIPRWLTSESDGRVRPTSEAFRDHLSFELSLFIAAETTQAKVLEGRPEDSLAEITAGKFRELNYGVARDEDPAYPGHVVVFPAPNKPHSRILAKQATLIFMPE